MFGCDSRLSDQDHIYTDTCTKYLVTDALVMTHSGVTQGLWEELETAPPKDLNALRSRMLQPVYRDRGASADVIAYSAAQDNVCWMDTQGNVTTGLGLMATGSGRDLAYGVLCALGPHTSLDRAAKAAVRALQVARTYDKNTGGTLHVLIVKLDGCVKIVHHKS